MLSETSWADSRHTDTDRQTDTHRHTHTQMGLYVDLQHPDGLGWCEKRIPACSHQLRLVGI